MTVQQSSSNSHSSDTIQSDDEKLLPVLGDANGDNDQVFRCCRFTCFLQMQQPIFSSIFSLSSSSHHHSRFYTKAHTTHKCNMCRRSLSCRSSIYSCFIRVSSKVGAADFWPSPAARHQRENEIRLKRYDSYEMILISLLNIVEVSIYGLDGRIKEYYTG